MTSTHRNLSLAVLSSDARSRTIGYSFLVYAGAYSFSGFRTKAGLLKWLDERGLKLTQELTEPGVASYQPLAGAFSEEMHYTEAEVARFHEITPAATCRQLNNGDYTLGKIVQDVDGHRTIHFLNPNIRDRVVFDMMESVALCS